MIICEWIMIFDWSRSGWSDNFDFYVFGFVKFSSLVVGRYDG